MAFACFARVSWSVSSPAVSEKAPLKKLAFSKLELQSRHFQRCVEALGGLNLMALTCKAFVIEAAAVGFATSRGLYFCVGVGNVE